MEPFLKFFEIHTNTYRAFQKKRLNRKFKFIFLYLTFPVTFKNVFIWKMKLLPNPHISLLVEGT